MRQWYHQRTEWVSTNEVHVDFSYIFPIQNIPINQGKPTNPHPEIQHIFQRKTTILKINPPIHNLICIFSSWQRQTINYLKENKWFFFQYSTQSAVITFSYSYHGVKKKFFSCIFYCHHFFSISIWVLLKWPFSFLIFTLVIVLYLIWN